MGSDFDIVIVGGGIVGSAIAFFLASDPDRPERIAVVERDPTYKSCSTVFATGVIRPQFSTPANIKMSLWSLNFLRESSTILASAKHDGEIGLREHHYMILVDVGSIDRFRRSLDNQQANGVDVRFLTPEDLVARFPLIDRNSVAGAFMSETGAGSFDPWALLQAFKSKAIELGVSYIDDEAIDVNVTDDHVDMIKLASGKSVTCNIFVNAAGARDAAKIARMAGFELPIEPRSRTTFYVASTADLSAMPMFILPSGVWIRPEGKGFLCGLTPDSSQDLPTEDFEVNYEQFEAEIWPLLAEVVPAFESIKMISAYCGHYDYHPLDENAVIGPVSSFDNVYVATGFSGHGVMHSPATGRIMADLILRGRYSEIDASVFRYDRVLTKSPVVELNIF